MNQKTARLLRTLYRHDKTLTMKQQKLYWKILNWHQRTELREKMQTFIMTAISAQEPLE